MNSRVARPLCIAALAGLAANASAQCPPLAPTGVVATQATECGSIIVNWNEVSGANNYAIYRNTSNSWASSSLVGASFFGDPQFTDITASVGTRYYYWVTAKRNLCVPGSGTSVHSASANGYRMQEPPAPTGVSATDGQVCGAVRVTWTQAPLPLGATVNGYTIYRNTVNVYLTSSEVGTVDSQFREFFDLTAAPGTTYYYWVRAGNGCGTAASDSDSGYISTNPTPPVNDNCSSALQVVAGGTYTGSTLCANRDGFSACAGLPANQGRDVWYRFLAPSNGSLHVDNCQVTGSFGLFDTLLSVHTNVCPGTAATQLACDDDSCGATYGPSTLDVPVLAGVSYLIRVGGLGASDMGTFNLHVGFTPTGTPCYPNCDSSTAAPILNVNDFTCFLNRYAAGNSYANCDASTIAPILNVNDFSCFMNRYASGCP